MNACEPWSFDMFPASRRLPKNAALDATSFRVASTFAHSLPGRDRHDRHDVLVLLMLYLGQIFLLPVQAPVHCLSQLFSLPPGFRPAQAHADWPREHAYKIFL